MAELILYTPIWDYTAENIIRALDLSKDEDSVDLRINSVGGNVFSGWGIAAKIAEVGNVNIKVDGMAASMAAALIPFAKSVEALDVSRIMIHRASFYGELSDQQKAFLKDMNKDLRAKLTAKIDESKLKELKGVSFKDIFDSEEVVDVWLTAKEAKSIGLIDKVVKLSPKDIEAFENSMMNIAASLTVKPNQKPTEKSIKKMTREELKAQHPEVYAAIVAEGVSNEKDRTGAWLTFITADTEAVLKGIKDGANLNQTASAELTLKLMSASALKNIAAAAPAAVVTEEVAPVVTAEEKKVVDFQAALGTKLGVKLT